MQVHVKINQENIKVDETFNGATADAIVGQVKARVAKEVPFFMRPMVNGMSNLTFAQEVVKRYNSNTNQNLPSPKTCDEFITMAQEQGIATVA
jgi:hypothetical protein